MALRRVGGASGRGFGPERAAGGGVGQGRSVRARAGRGRSPGGVDIQRDDTPAAAAPPPNASSWAAAITRCSAGSFRAARRRRPGALYPQHRWQPDHAFPHIRAFPLRRRTPDDWGGSLPFPFFIKIIFPAYCWFFFSFLVWFLFCEFCLAEKTPLKAFA